MTLHSSANEKIAVLEANPPLEGETTILPPPDDASEEDNDPTGWFSLPSAINLPARVSELPSAILDYAPEVDDPRRTSPTCFSEPGNHENFLALGPLLEDIDLDTVPLPIYPLPSKPFPVQPPQKIITGFAPIIPLDKSGKRVRVWRTANREIRGIAGGRWFARAWVGEKESDYARATDTVSASSVVNLYPKVPPMSLSAGKAPASGRVRTAKAHLAASASAGPSRAGSAIPDLHAVRAPTKMRTILRAAAASEGGNDSDTPLAAERA